MNHDIYYHKYIKYKNKYLALQEQIGGENVDLVFICQVKEDYEELFALLNKLSDDLKKKIKVIFICRILEEFKLFVEYFNKFININYEVKIHTSYINTNDSDSPYLLELNKLNNKIEINIKNNWYSTEFPDLKNILQDVITIVFNKIMKDTLTIFLSCVKNVSIYEYKDIQQTNNKTLNSLQEEVKKHATDSAIMYNNKYLAF